MFHVRITTKIFTDNSGYQYEKPVIWIEGKTPLLPHVRYLVKNGANSDGWAQRSCRAVELFLDYMEANHGCFDGPEKMFETFADRLFTGTTDRHGEDPSGLRWKPFSFEYAKSLIDHLTRFSDYLNQESEGELVQINPLRSATDYEQMLNLAAYHHKINNSFLKHLDEFKKNRPDLSKTRNVVVKRKRHVESDVRAFPDDKFEDLIFTGFSKRRKPSSVEDVKNLNLRNVLISYLMHFGGLRMCEPFHIFVEDIMLDPAMDGCALVKVHDPVIGKSPEMVDGKLVSRSEYLKIKYALIDRKSTPKNKNYHAGWKNPLIDDGDLNCFYVRWFPLSKGVEFYELWKLYLSTQRVRPNQSGKHPFAFTNQDGRPSTIKQFEKAYIRAVEKIGLTAGRMYGTSPHCHRHAYAKRLTDAVEDPLYIKKAMHHRSIDSQAAYTMPTNDDVYSKLKSASEKFNNKNSRSAHMLDTIKAE